MIDRREFVQSLVALGTATALRPAAELFAAPNQELKGLADAALTAARQAGASYADIRINRYRNQFIFTRDRRVQNIVNTEDFGFGVRVIVDGTWGFASSSAVTKDDVAAVARQAGERAEIRSGSVVVEPGPFGDALAGAWFPLFGFLGDAERQ